MESHDILIEIGPDGKVRAEIRRAKGKACLKYAELLQSIIGKETDRELTSEYYEPESTASIDIVYRPTWPVRDPRDASKPVPTLPYGGTLAGPAFNLPGVRDFKTARILYQQSIAANVTNATAVIFFSDVVDSTRLTEELGVVGYRMRARQVESLVTSAIVAHGGTVVSGISLGDGFIGLFSSTRAAVDAAQQCAREVGETGLVVYFSRWVDLLPDSTPIEGKGVLPAVRVEAPAGAFADADPTLAKGLDVLRSKTTGGK